jgi:aspartate racemase
MHIGLIGGIGPAATEFYYRGLTDRHAKSGTRLELTIANAEVSDLTQNLTQKNARKQAEIFAALIARLKAAGAQAAAVTSMGGTSASASFCRYRRCRCSMASPRLLPPSGRASSRP